MGPLLYSLVRFVKPSNCLEIGAGLGGKGYKVEG